MPSGLFTDELFILEKEPIGSEIDITAEFVRYLYESEDGNFFIGLFITENYEEFVVTGNVPFALSPQRSYTVNGEINERENKHTGVMERQLKLRKIVTLKPTGEFQIIKFLSDITSSVIAPFIYDKYGDDTIKILRTDPEKVAKDFRGVTLKAAKQLQADILEALGEVSEAFPFLQGYGFSVDEVEGLLKLYGEEIKGKVEENPYILMKETDGFPGASFVRCDKIAADIGFDMRDPRRVKAGIEYALIRQGTFGHIYFELNDVIKQSLAILNKGTGVSIRPAVVESCIEEMILDNLLHFDSTQQTIYLKRYYHYEKELAFNLVALKNDNEWVPVAEREKHLNDILSSKSVELESKQREAILSFTQSKSGVGILNGGAGTGKTFTLNILLALLKRLHLKESGTEPHIQLMAPTGKAAKVMRGATNMSAETIHRSLGWSNEGFIYNTANPLPGDIIVVDEASMLDTYLAYSLTRALKPQAKLILLGDPNQLPSIGAGNVLHDIVNSGKFEAITLDVTKRQAEHSQVGINGRLIADMKMPEKDSDTLNPKAITKTKQTNQALVNQTYKALEYLLSLGIKEDDIQIITAGRKGITGMYNLNHKIQSILNPPKGSPEVLNQRFSVEGRQVELNFRIGDRVIHTTNTDKLQWVKKLPSGAYEPIMFTDLKIITNGEIGIIQDIFEETYITQSGRKQRRNVLIIQYDDGLVKYTNEDKRDLDHAYAMTIHKSQGSQWKAVIELISSEHRMLLDNSLLYTGYTRAEEYQILLADPQALTLSLKTRKAFERRTTLSKRIQETTI